MTVRHVPARTLGLTHASSVIDLVRSSEAASGMLTTLLEPLKESAPPYLPALAAVALDSFPVFALPELSAIVPELTESNEYAPTRPEVAALAGRAAPAASASSAT